MYDIERKKEEEKLNYILEQIELNIESNGAHKKQLNEKIKTASSSELNVLTNIITIVEKSLDNNLNSVNSPYFAKIDYFDYIENKNCILYIGKCGLEDTHEKILTVDWRAPISSVYYDCQPGKNTIKTYDGEELDLDLNLKRTFEIQNSVLLDFYDVNTISNDELLTKYLAKNKEAVLSEIVATIQKDQNEIIRESCSKNVIVQGGAGSGKTTVAMHRVSFLLYNFSKIYNSENFYILGNNEMFLNYITSILPSLDVKDIKHRLLSNFFIDFIDDYVPFKNGKNKFIDIFKIQNKDLLALKGKIGFVKELGNFIAEYEDLNIPIRSIKLRGKVIMEKSNMISLLRTFKYKSMQEKISLLNEQFKKRLSNELELLNVNNAEVIMKKNANVFGKSKIKISILDIYNEFLENLIEKIQNKEIQNIEESLVQGIIDNIKKKQFDIFDIANLTLIKRKICTNKKFEDVRHIVIDEAQDFGVSIFYVLRNAFAKSTFTIVGDVTQNINYNIGMNDWEHLTNNVFNESKDKFYILKKSYRNTIEISEFACSILKNAKFKTYEIEPYVRHGSNVEVLNENSFEAMIEKTKLLIKQIFAKEYKTVGIICKTEEEVEMVKSELSKFIEIVSFNNEDTSFSNGVMIMSVKMSKGLEFDTVILWNVNDNNYKKCDSDVKLLYVAITRALHELYVLYEGKITALLEN
ncbi:ATP-binding domain-containing protein [Sedimentibacter sp. zth1]|uniref:HelD family protein n=1 Tax=Sedimentibacter sp. zth1 TaxID=2816908 RepID=UPI001A92D65B|nr:3'-5' exonuclease [Sedimentibacter sp. zth1]QSX06371.1 ATP-binding domain-containing protein [Sedimentibacter sp. zth1]